MDNENKQVNKKLYIALLVCTIIAILAIVITAIAVGVSNSGIDSGDVPGIVQPGENEKPSPTPGNKPSDNPS